MSQSDFGTIDPTLKTGTQLAIDLNGWRTAVHSSHSGVAAPTYVVAGLRWLDTSATPWILKIYDGADWISVFAIDATANKAYPIGGANILNFAAAGGTANALTLTPSPAITAYVDLDTVSFEATATNTTAATMSISGVGAKAIRKMNAGVDVALVAGDLVDGIRYILNYDTAANAGAGAWILINGSPDFSTYATLTGAQTLTNKTVKATSVASGGTPAGGDIIFNWSGLGGQPTWLFGGNTPTGIFVYNPANFSVNFANSANVANTATTATNAVNCTSAQNIQGSSVAQWCATFGAGTVGSYAWLRSTTAGVGFSAGTTYAGSNLDYAGIVAGGSGIVGSGVINNPPGTWRAMGSIIANGSFASCTLFLRIA